jgi:hypothetical protein
MRKQMPDKGMKRPGTGQRQPGTAGPGTVIGPTYRANGMVMWVAAYEKKDGSAGCVAKLTMEEPSKNPNDLTAVWKPLYLMTSSHRLQTVLEAAILKPESEFGVEFHGRKVLPRPDCPWCKGWDTDYPVYEPDEVKLSRS